MADTAGGAGDDADKNPFFIVVNKRLRLVKKKMQKIEVLEAKDPAELNHEQEVLLQNKQTVEILYNELTQIISAFEQEIPAPETTSKKSKEKAKEPQAPAPAPAPEKAEMECQTDPEPTPEPPPVAEEKPREPENAEAFPAYPPQAPPVDTASILGLFKAFAVVSHSYLYLRLCCALEYDASASVNAAHLKELVHLAQLVLEIPIPDASIILRQEKTGAEHLALFLANSPTYPAVLGADGETFNPMSLSYAQLRQVLDRVCRAMKTDQLLQTHVLSAAQGSTDANNGKAEGEQDAHSGMQNASTMRGMNGTSAPQSHPNQHDNRLQEGSEGQMNGVGENGGDGANADGSGARRGQRRRPQEGGGRKPGGGGEREGGSKGREGGFNSGGRGPAKPRVGQ